MASLIKLGPKILPLLPDAATPPRRRAQGSAREDPSGPEGQEPDIKPGASKVTIKGKGIRLSEALQQLPEADRECHHRLCASSSAPR